MDDSEPELRLVLALKLRSDSFSGSLRSRKAGDCKESSGEVELVLGTTIQWE